MRKYKTLSIVDQKQDSTPTKREVWHRTEGTLDVCRCQAITNAGYRCSRDWTEKVMCPSDVEVDRVRFCSMHGKAYMEGKGLTYVVDPYARPSHGSPTARFQYARSKES